MREKEAPAARPRARPTTQVATDLSRLLRARSFFLGDSPACARVAANLQAFGGQSDPAAAVWIGDGPVPGDRPSISLGDEPGTLGPRSFGFLNNVDGVVPLAAPMAERPRKGGVALVVPRRDALPEMVPLLNKRRLGVSWLISVGDGDPAEAVRFLSVDPATTGILVALGRGARAATLHGALGDKQAVLLDLQSGAGPGREGMLCRAVARRAGVSTVTGLEEWLAHGALFDVAARAEPERRRRVALLCVGGGGDFVAAEAQRVRLPAPQVVEDEPEVLQAALAQAAAAADLVLLCGDPDVTGALSAPRPTVRVDPSQPERLRALLSALALRAPGPADARPVPVKPDADKVSAILADLPPPLYVSGHVVLEETLSDHDTKRLLHAYGARVSRQAPANTVTAVLRVAGKIGLPVMLLPAGPEAEAALPDLQSEREGSCSSQAELKRHATLLLERAPHVMVREQFPETPRARLTVTGERGLGRVLRLGGEAALLPLLRGEARELAESALAEAPACDPRGLTELLGQIAACAQEREMTLDLQLFLSSEPAVVCARGTLRRPEARSR